MKTGNEINTSPVAPG